MSTWETGQDDMSKQKLVVCGYCQLEVWPEVNPTNQSDKRCPSCNEPMSDPIDDGGPAFAYTDWSSNGFGACFVKGKHPGMSLRQYYAAEAMKRVDWVDRKGYDDFKAGAAKCYAMADAMIAFEKKEVT